LAQFLRKVKIPIGLYRQSWRIDGYISQDICADNSLVVDFFFKFSYFIHRSVVFTTSTKLDTVNTYLDIFRTATSQDHYWLGFEKLLPKTVLLLNCLLLWNFHRVYSIRKSSSKRGQCVKAIHCKCWDHKPKFLAIKFLKKLLLIFFF
jgi:hypothetical protein